MQINTSMTSSEVFGEISRAFFAHGDPLSDWTVIPWSRSRVKKLLFVDTARVVCGRIYVTAWCPSVRLSAPSVDRCGWLLLSARQQHGAQQQMRAVSRYQLT